MRIAGLLFLLPAAALGAGFEMTVNGAKPLMQGGAVTAEADDLSAIQYNPAGLAQKRGFSFLLDGQLLWHNTTFQREDCPAAPAPCTLDPANPPMTNVQPVNNTGGLFVVPMLGIGYGFGLFDRTLSIALGVYGPPSDGHYVYPTPNYMTDSMGKYIMDPRKYAPQRYALISNNILIAFPTLAISYEVHPKVLIGVSLQPVIASFSFSQSITSNLAPAKNQANENPFFDSVVNVNLPLQYVQFTGVFGVLVKPIDMLSIGASYHPPVPITAKGKLNIDLGQAAKALMTTVTGDDATLQLTLPQEFRLGVRVKPMRKLGINLDFVYQGWQSVQDILLTPNNVTLQMGTGMPKPVSGFDIHKGWNHSHQFHLGANYNLFPWLSLHLGGWYESSAIPSSTIGVDFLHFDQVVLTGGIGIHVFDLDLYLGAAGSPATTHAVTNSTSQSGSTDPTVAGSIIGNGIYTSGSFMVTAGIRGTFGGKTPLKPLPPPELPPEAIPAEPGATTPAPAPDAAPAPASGATPAPAPAQPVSP